MHHFKHFKHQWHVLSHSLAVSPVRMLKWHAWYKNNLIPLTIYYPVTLNGLTTLASVLNHGGNGWLWMIGNQGNNRGRGPVCKPSRVDASNTRAPAVPYKCPTQSDACVRAIIQGDIQGDRLLAQMLLPTSRNNPSIIECRYPEPPILRQRVSTPSRDIKTKTKTLA